MYECFVDKLKSENSRSRAGQLISGGDMGDNLNGIDALRALNGMYSNSNSKKPNKVNQTT